MLGSGSPYKMGVTTIPLNTHKKMLYYKKNNKRVFPDAEQAWRWVFMHETEERYQHRTGKWNVYKVKNTPYYCLSTKRNHMPKEMEKKIQKIKARKRQLKRTSAGGLTRVRPKLGWKWKLITLIKRSI